ncbi:NYN domain-containing protein [Actinocorallia sp. API 0066]|uniref:NYN domain-containing protein n=1 Tax=Actinocorallia sp. API 0066 TaxID=2896846 RepID=UPI001E5F1C6F|nr:NYN domain-containing protein [Actinocorallia sp. API 0066]MCD0450986.1 NYN domain-containing protein [Actinocorallia sp. API 0066]
MTKSAQHERRRTRSGTISSDESLRGPLPEAVRRHVVEAAAEVLAALPPDDVPVPLRRIAKFRPKARAREGGSVIAKQLEADPDFRGRVAEALRAAEPDLVSTLERGEAPAGADTVQVAAAAYLLRSEGWPERVETARAELARAREDAREAQAVQEAAQLRARLEEARAARAAEMDKLRAELKGAKAEIADLRRKLGEERRVAREAVERAAELDAARRAENEEAMGALGAVERELRTVRAKLASAETALEAHRKAAREGRSIEDVRLRLLLDTLVDAAQGVRRELNLPSVISRPADHVAASGEAGTAHGRSLSENDFQLFHELLTLPGMHLIVDGYNVTKTGYGDIPLADQRARLISGLGGLYSQTRAEITVVFDGAQVEGHVAVQAPRGVRVLFSRPGQIADELIAELARAEPPGRVFVVVSSDQEVAASARRAGGRTATAGLLLRRLGRF